MHTEYIPKGGMCATCANKNQDCSYLPFESMPVIEPITIINDEGIQSYKLAVVRCVNYWKGPPQM